MLRAHESSSYGDLSLILGERKYHYCRQCQRDTLHAGWVIRDAIGPPLSVAVCLSVIGVISRIFGLALVGIVLLLLFGLIAFFNQAWRPHWHCVRCGAEPVKTRKEGASVEDGGRDIRR